ncbi:amino acid ABC transporter permease [Helicobacter sp. MIT 14-3879]|uniref:amino acid ABC transporter permease n=1 Tax=Helicobacter sp. MIT 14-3879 TaxID=2040649 RepID=UPI000E1F567D|nr:amino acid ABC transporter permease [Helicobacter sp. MIT 14-3879]RDU63992.1 amino acid ABC transporter permease [Helicobacter sp. MIT 14-3879]
MFELLNEGNNLERILFGLLLTTKIAFISIIFSFIFGIIFGIIMTSKNKFINLFFRFYLESIRIVPILVWLFLIFYGLPKISPFHFSSSVSAIIIFVLWGSIEMGDLVRGSIISLPKHQIESALSLGMEQKTINRYIIMPQIIARILPSSINLASRIIKTTSLLPLIGVVEMLKVGQQIIEASILKVPDASFYIYGTIFILYFAICYPLSILSSYLENKFKF